MKTKGIYFLYRFLQALAFPILLLYFLARGLARRGYFASLAQRFGFLPRSFKQTGPGAIWLHAVSVGEVLGCVEFLRRLRAELPNSRLFVSTGTLAGQATAREKLADLGAGVFYAPVDYVFAVRRVLRILRPSVVVIAETEIWPNLFREAKRTGAGLAIVNGRISDRAFARYRRWRWLFSVVLPLADTILAQSEAMRERFLALGAPGTRSGNGGNFKYDFEARPALPESPAMALIARVRPSKIWVAASTMPPARAGDVDEDDAVIAAFRELAPRQEGLLLLWAPRKPERFDDAARKLDVAGISYLRRSRLAGGESLALPGVLLLDSIGELSGLFAGGGVVFMGGTLAERGGHNLLEPAMFAKPVIVGPHMENFQEIADQFAAADALVRIASSGELAGAVDRLLRDIDEAGKIGRRALACAQERRGASARAAAKVRGIHAENLPGYRPALPWYWPAKAMARAWELGSQRKREADLRASRKVDAPVISVGNLTMGGTGKTPCVLRLAELLKASGRSPGILTRGYARSSPEAALVVAPGAAIPAQQSGDEPQIFVRSGLAPVGIGGNRYKTGMLLRRDFLSDVLLLDDGFQHWKLARNVDILLIDALNPLGGGSVFPLGRLREPVEALGRADIVLITRSGFTDLALPIERTVRRWNSAAPVFRAMVEPLAWVDAEGCEYALGAAPFKRAGGFCGLGNPQSFRRTLERLGTPPVEWIEFRDHHHYRPRELHHIAHQFTAAGAEAAVTTEKDSVNLPDGFAELLAPIKLYWLKTRMRIDKEEEFLQEILKRMPSPGR
ncbi:MAG TPA: tetraacyldisaccharide 4'-kinase [Bryobacteraceae bacterium]|nr:tetraacyldisaccharide 4'-kinase [Bryobacteraceae bacterium]